MIETVRKWCLTLRFPGFRRIALGFCGIAQNTHLDRTSVTGPHICALHHGWVCRIVRQREKPLRHAMVFTDECPAGFIERKFGTGFCFQLCQRLGEGPRCSTGN